MSYSDPSSPITSESLGAAGVWRIVIVGGRPAAHRCELELPSLGFDSSIKLVNAEAVPPYSRSPLFKDILLAPDTPIATMAVPSTHQQLATDLRSSEACAISATGDQGVA
jgi:hypothetical protein